MQCGAVGLPRSKRTKDQLAKSLLETMASGRPAFPLPTAGLIVPFKCPMCGRHLPFIAFLAGIQPAGIRPVENPRASSKAAFPLPSSWGWCCLLLPFLLAWCCLLLPFLLAWCCLLVPFLLAWCCLLLPFLLAWFTPHPNTHTLTQTLHRTSAPLLSFCSITVHAYTVNTDGFSHSEINIKATS